MAAHANARGKENCAEKASPICVDEITQHNIEIVEHIEKTISQHGRADSIADRISAICGTMAFALFHILWFLIWIVWNAMPRFRHWDPYPFPFLTFTVSLEAILLTIFILISQNRQSEISERRNKLDLQINLLSEQENSQMIVMLEKIMNKLGIDRDETAEALAMPLQPEKVVEQLEEIATGLKAQKQ